MIYLSKIDANLTIYKENKVVLFGAGQTGKAIKLELARNGIEVSCFFDNDSSKWGGSVRGIPVYAPTQLKQQCGAETVVQIACISATKAIERQLKESGIDNYVTYLEYQSRMQTLYLYRTVSKGNFEIEFLQGLLKSFFALDRPTERMNALHYACRIDQLGYDSYNILCLPPKTGNQTLGKSIPAFCWSAVECVHTFKNVPMELKQILAGKKQKIVTAVRDVISQNLSMFFQINTHFGLNPEYWESGGDVQALFNSWIEHELKDKTENSNVENEMIQFMLLDIKKEAEGIDTYLLQNFFEKNFEPYACIDVFQYPFDKEKGYTIIELEEQDTEIFIYQLERMNDIADELGQFLGIEDFHLVNGNVGGEKWYANAYRQAKRELKLSRAYFDACFSSRVMTHFYSDVDIEKFRQYWLPHVKD